MALNPNRVGELIGERFLLEEIVGSGGMGTVWRARDTQSGDLVALKVLRDAQAAHLERFLREAHVLAEIHHPGVASYVAHGLASQGEPFLAMEWLVGEDLSVRLSAAGLSMTEAVQLTRGVAEVLAVLHPQGIVHRDIKPSNLFLVGGNPAQIKLLDFGVARLTQAAAKGSTTTGMMLGTPGYMAPEQARGERDVDARADLFSLGCVLFECLAGQPPFVADHPIAVLAKILLDEAPRLSSLRPSVSAPLEDLVATLLAKQPRERLPSAGALREALAGLGPLEDTERVSQVSSPRAMTSAERRLCSVVLAGRPETWVHLSSGVTAPADVDSASRTQTASGAGLVRAVEPGLRAAVEPLGGIIHLVGDTALVATFSTVGAVTDQVSSAARAGLAFRRLLPDLPIALATGRGVVTENWPMGEVIDRAAELLGRQASFPSAHGVAIDELTAGLLRSGFEVVDGQSQGQRQLLRELPSGRHAARLLLGRATPFVGRDRELDRLGGLVADSIEEPEARVALVVAPPGTGKSRLRDELMVRLRQEHPTLQIASARGDALRMGAPFFLVSQLLRSALRVADGVAAELARAQLAAWLQLLPGLVDRERVHTFLGHIAIGPDAANLSAQLQAATLDPALMSDQIRRAWEECLVAAVERAPVLLVIDDLQWCDLPSVRLLDGALRRLTAHPLVVLALARPAVHDVFPHLWRERGLEEMSLRELPRRALLQLARAALGEGPSAEELEHLVSLADGNALHLEELIRTAAQGHTADRPATVIAMLQARLEALDLPMRRVLRAGSIFGAAFTRKGVAHLLGESEHSIEAPLEDLIEREIVEVTMPSGPSTAGVFGFRHALLREAATSMLIESDAALGHRLAGDWLERQGERNALMLAAHFEQGGEPRRAAPHLLRAADDALTANDLEAAVVSAARGMALASDVATVGELHRVQAEAFAWRSDSEQALLHAQEAMRRCDRDSESWYRAATVAGESSARLARVDVLDALGAELLAPRRPEAAPGPFAVAAVRVGWGLYTTGRTALGRQLLARLEEIASPLRSVPRVFATLQVAGATRSMLDGKLEEWMGFERSSADAYLAMGDIRRSCEARASEGFALCVMGAFPNAIEVLQRARREAESLGIASIQAVAEQNLGVALARVGRTVEGLQALQRSAEAFRRRGDQRLEGGSRSYLGRILAEIGRLDEASSEIGQALRILEPYPPLRLVAMAVQVDILLRQGRVAESTQAASAMARRFAEVGAVEEGEAYLGWVQAQALAAGGDRAQAYAVAAAVVTRIEEQFRGIHDPDLQRSFREAIPEHAELFKLVRALAPS